MHGILLQNKGKLLFIHQILNYEKDNSNLGSRNVDVNLLHP